MTSCTFNKDKITGDKNQDQNSIHFFVKTDSTFELNNTTFRLSQLDSILAINDTLDKVILTPDRDIAMTTIRQLESILALRSVPEIIYRHDNDSVRLYLAIDPTNHINIKLTNDSGLTIGQRKIHSDDELVTILRTEIIEKSKSRITMSASKGISYDFYAREKDRIQSTVDKIDSNLTITDGTTDLYEQK